MMRLAPLSVLGFLFAGCIIGPSELGGRPQTAAHSLRAVDSVATLTHPGLRLMSVISRNVNADGTAELWQYRYVDTAIPHNSYWFHASSSAGVAFDSTGETEVGAGVITHGWIDSDAAISIAEQDGGMRFRELNPQCTITASLGEPVVPDPQITWWIAYRSTASDAKLYLSVNATSGFVVRQ